MNGARGWWDYCESQGHNPYYRHVVKYRLEDNWVTKEDGTEGRRAVVQSYNANGMIDPNQDVKSYEIKGKFDVRVATGSSLPFAKAEKENKLLAYFDREIIDAEEVLKSSEYPNYEAVLTRMEQKAAQQAAAEAQAAPAPPAA